MNRIISSAALAVFCMLAVLGIATRVEAQTFERDALDVGDQNLHSLVVPQQATAGDGAHLIILGAGYDATTQDRFFATARLIEDRVRATSPYAGSKISFAPFRTNADLGCIGASGGSPVLTPCDPATVVNTAAASGIRHEEILVLQYHPSLSNQPIKKGWGWRDGGDFKINPQGSYAIVLDTVFGPEVAIHELGHSLLNLADEYPYDHAEDVASSPNCVASREVLAAFGPVFQSCSGRNDFFRPEPSAMRTNDIPTYNRASIEWRGFPYGGRERMEYWDGPAVNEPPTPQNFRAVVTGSTVVLTWDPVPGASYVIEAGSQLGLSDLGGIPVAQADLEVPNVPSGTYYVRVRSKVGGLVSQPTADQIVIVGSSPGPCSPPPPVTGLQYETSGGFLITLWWEPSPTATSYEVTANGALVWSGASTQVAGAAPDGTYVLTVFAKNSCGRSSGVSRTVTLNVIGR